MRTLIFIQKGLTLLPLHAVLGGYTFKRLGQKTMADGCLLHPLPRRDEIAVCCDHDPRAMYWRQMRNGMWIRAALIAATFGFEKDIMSCGY